MSKKTYSVAYKRPQCELCMGEVLENQKALMKHNFVFHRESYYMCPFCVVKKKLCLDETRTGFKAHLRRHGADVGDTHTLASREPSELLGRKMFFERDSDKRICAVRVVVVQSSLADKGFRRCNFFRYPWTA